MRTILILFAHPALEKSQVNRALLRATEGLPFVTVNDLYEVYPDFEIDVDREQALLLAHDYVLMQHPFYWYSAPPIIKQWEDLVLEHGWAYGRTGKALAGKNMMNVITTGGQQTAYQPTGFNRFSIREFLRPFEQTAVLCNMTYLPPFVVHGTHRITPEQTDSYVEYYRALLTGLGEGRIQPDQLTAFTYTNEYLIPFPIV
ncbi:NAD(P)H oxidoreductase [Rudanella paleaurantiibacter]|uniref:NAD(P)H oxidoreductase n=1 Tax=Rudanella paleaurantiibacter TaxID=2614655 RepID=A0A7J5U0I0_9BACT|nr:NAD(P)H-dependent oxidoreductase [Rudanella paleaurantiibacter]KAB7731263.1 NAD(P)H oxidoreductase [Rudanella paleaurantiibacter]